ncbi:hypothetical protein L208DRAFT_557306, partial [Tricholoma matsutake]
QPNDPLDGLLATADPILGVSKRCCPVCSHLLSVALPPHIADLIPFVIKGSHTTITPCSLPDCLPRPILKDMVEVFGEQLRVVLDNLASTNAAVRRRSLSTGTQRISPTPSEPSEDESEPPHADQEEMNDNVDAWRMQQYYEHFIKMRENAWV